ncbi:MAG TPA: TMEM175 family protein [Sphingomicrobium sp.]|nr:TMEM175 family protein [Sphingomicrobium sp.]
MSPSRLNALTDGVVAIVLTLMVLELKFPASATVGAVLAVLPLLAAYLLAFVNVAIYWNNHHHMMHSAHRVTGSVLWTNHSLLFWLTLFPLMIRWIDEAGITALPVASFGLVLVGASTSYLLLERALIRAEGDGSAVRRALGGGTKERISFVLYLAAVPGAFVSPYISILFYLVVAILWLAPDRRFERPGAP